MGEDGKPDKLAKREGVPAVLKREEPKDDGSLTPAAAEALDRVIEDAPWLRGLPPLSSYPDDDQRSSKQREDATEVLKREEPKDDGALTPAAAEALDRVIEDAPWLRGLPPLSSYPDDDQRSSKWTDRAQSHKRQTDEEPNL
jgi:hypothetical protein